MILGYTGTLGGGKTLCAVRDAWVYSLEAGGAPVWGNLTLHAGGWAQHRLVNPAFKLGRVSAPDDIVRMVAEGGGILILDEVHQDLDARQSLATQNILLSRFLMYMRKSGITVLYTAQDAAMIDKRMRAVTDLITWCEGWGPRNARTHRFTRIHYRSGRQVRVEVLTSDQLAQVYPLYDTLEFVRQLEFPSRLAEFEVFMLAIEEASRFARSYTGPADRAWETFMAETGYSPGRARARRTAVASGGTVRVRTRRRAGNRGGPDTELAAQLEAADENGGLDHDRQAGLSPDPAGLESGEWRPA